MRELSAVIPGRGLQPASPGIHNHRPGLWIPRAFAKASARWKSARRSPKGEDRRAPSLRSGPGMTVDRGESKNPRGGCRRAQYFLSHFANYANQSIRVELSCRPVLDGREPSRVIPGRAAWREPGIHNPRPWIWIPGSLAIGPAEGRTRWLGPRNDDGEREVQKRRPHRPPLRPVPAKNEAMTGSPSPSDHLRDDMPPLRGVDRRSAPGLCCVSIHRRATNTPRS